MKITNFINTILYKIYSDSILISNEYKNRNVIVDEINLKLNNWISLLNSIVFNNNQLEKIKLSLIHEISDLFKYKNINVYEIWKIQNKIDLLLSKRL